MIMYTGFGILSCATWPTMPTKHSNGLINESITIVNNSPLAVICAFLVLNLLPSSLRFLQLLYIVSLGSLNELSVHK